MSKPDSLTNHTSAALGAPCANRRYGTSPARLCTSSRNSRYACHTTSRCAARSIQSFKRHPFGSVSASAQKVSREYMYGVNHHVIMTRTEIVMSVMGDLHVGEPRRVEPGSSPWTGAALPLRYDRVYCCPHPAASRARLPAGRRSHGTCLAALLEREPRPLGFGIRALSSLC